MRLFVYCRKIPTRCVFKAIHVIKFQCKWIKQRINQYTRTIVKYFFLLSWMNDVVSDKGFLFALWKKYVMTKWFDVNFRFESCCQNRLFEIIQNVWKKKLLVGCVMFVTRVWTQGRGFDSRLCLNQRKSIFTYNNTVVANRSER